MRIINKLSNTKKDLICYIKETYTKFLVTYIFTLSGFCLFFSMDLWSTFKTITGISLFFYSLFFVYHLLEKRKNTKKNQNKKSFFSWFKKRRFNQEEKEDLKNKMKEFISQVNKV